MASWTPALRSSAALLTFTIFASITAPSPASAQASREGPTFGVSTGVGGTVKRPDVAFDSVNNVYLVVTGGLTSGRFVAADGTPLGSAFYIPQTGAYNQTPRVAYSPHLGGFLVTWLDTRANPAPIQVWGRLVQFGAGGAPVFASGDFLIGAPVGGVHPERGAAIAYSTTSQRFLVLWHQNGGGGSPGNDVRGQFVSNAATLLGGVINVSFDNHFQGEMAVEYSPASNQFLVAYRNFYEPSGPATVQVRTINADTGSPGASLDVTAGRNVDSPEVTYNSTTNQFLVGWWQDSNYFGRFVNPDGAVASNVVPLILNYGGYDSLGLRYNALTNTYFAVIHGRAPQGFPQEDVGAQISATGTPDVEFAVTANGSTLGNFNPRLAASTSAREWLMATSTGFVQVSGQRIKSSNVGGPPPPPPPPPTPPPPPPDIELTAASAPNGSWFLAEGAASAAPGGFATYYLIANENPEPVTVRAYFASDDGRRSVRTFTVPAGRRYTVNLVDEAGPGSFATVFQSLTPGADVFVERSIYWGNNFEGSTGATAVKDLSTSWMFAEGSRGGEYFRNYFLLFNPLQAPTNVKARFYLANGAVVDKPFFVPAQGRLTIDANEIAELKGLDFATTFIADTQIVAERAMYWGTPTWIGGTAAFGVTSTSPTWHFAEGAAAVGFETFYLIQNPNPLDITVRAAFFLEDGSTQVRNYTVKANSRQTVYLNAELGTIGGVAASFDTSPDTPIVMERAVYWGAGRVEGTAAAGMPAGAYEWHLPEGAAGGKFDTFMLLSNPTSVEAPLDVTLYIEGVGRFTAPPSMRPVLKPFSRTTIHMNTFLTQLGALENVNLTGASFSTRVKVVGNVTPILVEHVLYWQRDGANYWRGGSGSFGIPR